MPCGAGASLRVLCVSRVVLLCALFYCPGRIVWGVFLCSEDALRKILSVFFRVNSAEKCDLTRGVVLFSERVCCYCVPVHGNCGF